MAHFKTPNQRRLKKWQSRTSRIIRRAKQRGFPWFVEQVCLTDGMWAAAKRIGARLDGPSTAVLTTDELLAILWPCWMMGCQSDSELSA